MKESSLGHRAQPNARTVGGITVRKVFYAPAHKSATPNKILQLGGLVLTATCGNGDLEAAMTSTVDHAHLASEMWNSAGDGSPDGLHHSDFGPHSQSISSPWATGTRTARRRSPTPGRTGRS